MQTIETRAAETSAPEIATSRRPGRRIAPALAIVAATLFAGVIGPAPAAAFTDWAADTAGAPRTAFHHHFYRGVPGQNRHRGTTDADVTALADEPSAQEEAAMSFCADRFRSYDPSTGTYLGYDGDEHACP